jgi:MscS family membrane protein
MNFDFLNTPFGGLTIMDYVRFGVILTFAIFFKRYLSSLIIKLCFALLKKFSSDFYSSHFKSMVLVPIQGLLITIFFYIATNQLSDVLDNIIVFKRNAKTIAANGQTSLSKMVSLMDVIDKIFYLFLTFYITLTIARIIAFLFLVVIDKAKERGDRERQQILPLLKDVLVVIVWIFAVLSALGTVFNVNVAALIAGLGVGGVAIAFAAKESLENLLASFMVMIDKPFTIGDWIKINGVEGNIEKVGFRSTRIRTFDNSLVSIPNRKLIDNNLENFSDRGSRRVKFMVGAVYGLSVSTLNTTMEAIKKSIMQTDGVSDITPSVYIEELGDFSVNIQIVYFIKINSSVDFKLVKQTVYLNIYEIMYQHAKGFAYPSGNKRRRAE